MDEKCAGAENRTTKFGQSQGLPASQHRPIQLKFHHFSCTVPLEGAVGVGSRLASKISLVCMIHAFGSIGRSGPLTG